MRTCWLAAARLFIARNRRAAAQNWPTPQSIAKPVPGERDSRFLEQLQKKGTSLGHRFNYRTAVSRSLRLIHCFCRMEGKMRLRGGRADKRCAYFAISVNLISPIEHIKIQLFICAQAERYKILAKHVFVKVLFVLWNLFDNNVTCCFYDRK